MEPKKRLINKHGKPRWEVDFGLDESGKRHRPYWEHEADADAAIDAWKKAETAKDTWWPTLTKLEKRSVSTVCMQIKAAGYTLERVWQEHQAWREERAQKPKVEEKAYEDVVAHFRKHKLESGDSERYVEEVCTILTEFGKGRERIPINKILPEDLNVWINGRWDNLNTRRTQRGRFSSLWSVAIDAGWAQWNIVEKLGKIKVPGNRIWIYPNRDILNLFAAILYNDSTAKRIIMPMAAEAFGCMRPEEIEGVKARKTETKPFDWSNIDLKHGRSTVYPNVSKVGDQRTIRLHPTAVAWYKLADELKNPLPPVNERRLVDQCCELINLEHWERDGLRKCCATHLLNHYGNELDVVKDCGNSIRVLLASYADLHTPKEVSEEYFNITPKKVREYMKTPEWEKVLKAAAQARAKRTANDTAKSAG
jgi:hypothetical protein